MTWRTGMKIPIFFLISLVLIGCAVQKIDCGQKNTFIPAWETNLNAGRTMTTANDTNGDPVIIYYTNGVEAARETTGSRNGPKIRTGVIPEGVIRQYDHKKLVAEWTYKKGKPEGLSKTYFENGRLNEVCPYKDGKKNGLLRRYREYGILIGEYHYKNGMLDGLSTEYDENEQLQWKAFYKNGVPDGLWNSYYENGRLKEESTYRDGKLTGPPKSYDENGKLRE
jgi:antitoxin component YwqK of YwqJK toxin-antitoxin module